MAIKELNTRIALKYDSYSAWTTAPGKDLVLLKGEIGICNIDAASQGSNVVPTVLFKVGDGTKTFENLPWASAKAADVYQWAKASQVKRVDKKLVFVGGGDNGADLEVAFDYVTLSEVQAITDALGTRVTNIENSLGDSGTIGSAIKGVEERLDVLEGSGDGSVSQAIQMAVDQVRDEIPGVVNQALSDANEYTDTEIAKVNEKNGTQDTAIAANTGAIEKEVEDREAAIEGVTTAFQNADNAINAKIGGSYTSSATVHDAIVAAANAASAADTKAGNAQTAVDNLRDVTVAQHTTAIADLNTAVENEAKARGDKDTELEGRLEEVEAFFHTADGETLDTALDTLKEIQDYLNGDGSATDGIIGRVAAAEGAIEDLEAEFEANGRVSKAETAVAALKDVTDGYTSKGSIKAAVDAAKEQADKGVADAKTADDKAVAADNKAAAAASAAKQAQDEVDALEGVVAEVSGVANKATTDLAALTTKVGNAETAITNLQTLTSGDNGNAKLRSDITTLQQLTSGANGNNKLREDLTALSNTITDGASGLAATKGIADEANARSKANATAIEAIADDYVKASDFIGDSYIFNCGSATTVTHTAPAAAN